MTTTETEATAAPSAMTLEAMAREFHRALRVHAGFAPEQPTAAVPVRLQKLRQALLDEEVQELRDAVEARDVVKIADALGDIAYVIGGTAVTYGIPLDAVLAEVHKSNMTKTNTPAEAKLVKGPRYEPPDIAGVLGVDHVVVSIYGWNCDTCGRPVSGRTDEAGLSCRADGLTVRHIRHDDAEERAEAAWLAHHGE